MTDPPTKKTKMSSTQTSRQLREDGNEHYKQAGEAATLSIAADFLKKAVNAYEEALQAATDNEERCFALRNMGMAYWHLGKNCNNRALAAVNEKQEDGVTYHYSTSHRTDYSPYFMLHFYKEAISAFRRCVPLVDRTESNGRGKKSNVKSDTSTKFFDRLIANVNECAQEAISFLTNMDYFPTYKCRIEQLDHLITASGDAFRDWLAVLHLEKAKTYHKWAVTEMERSKNYVTALHCLKECYSPLEIVHSSLLDIHGETVADGIRRSKRLKEKKMAKQTRCAFGEFTIKHHEELEDLIQSVRADTAVAEAMRLIQEGDKRLQSSILDAEQLNVDGVHDAIDNYRAAIVALHDKDGLDFILEAEAFSKMGQVYFNVLKNVTQGKSHCLTAVQLAGTVERHNFAGKDWFDKATGILKLLQDDQRKKEEEAVRKDREPFMKALKKQLKELNAYHDESAETMIADFPTKFPPKHKAGSKVIVELAKKKFTDDTPRSDVKKALSKLILLYHPDHVDIKVHGGEYFVLCEEITKVITRKYECFKG